LAHAFEARIVRAPDGRGQDIEVALREALHGAGVGDVVNRLQERPAIALPPGGAQDRDDRHGGEAGKDPADETRGLDRRGRLHGALPLSSVAISRIRTQSSGYERPAALAAIGTRLCPVMPGDVFISMKE